MYIKFKKLRERNIMSETKEPSKSKTFIRGFLKGLGITAGVVAAFIIIPKPLLLVVARLAIPALAIYAVGSLVVKGVRSMNATPDKNVKLDTSTPTSSAPKKEKSPTLSKEQKSGFNKSADQGPVEYSDPLNPPAQNVQKVKKRGWFF